MFCLNFFYKSVDLDHLQKVEKYLQVSSLWEKELLYLVLKSLTTVQSPIRDPLSWVALFVIQAILCDHSQIMHDDIFRNGRIINLVKGQCILYEMLWTRI